MFYVIEMKAQFTFDVATYEGKGYVNYLVNYLYHHINKEYGQHQKLVNFLLHTHILFKYNALASSKKFAYLHENLT